MLATRVSYLPPCPVLSFVSHDHDSPNGIRLKIHLKSGPYKIEHRLFLSVRLRSWHLSTNLYILFSTLIFTTERHRLKERADQPSREVPSSALIYNLSFVCVAFFCLSFFVSWSHTYGFTRNRSLSHFRFGLDTYIDHTYIDSLTRTG